jgi:large subunit ribosomal protein L4e
MAARPVVSVYSATEDKTVGTLPLPDVLVTPIRQDIVHRVHTNVAKNHRQSYGVNMKAGMQQSAISWGTGRAVSRIPRICGGGTHRSGQGAFGNQCRGGRMFNPTKHWRKWTAKTNNNERRVAVCSALAASAVPALLMARGHRVSTVQEVPLVVHNDIEACTKTKDALALLKVIKAMEDVEHVKDSRKIRRGTGKMRNRRYVERKGPLIVYANNNGIEQAFRNIPGIELACVDRLNLLKLAPGGHLGRFVIWTQAAFEKLDSIFGTYTAASDVKKTFSLPRTMMNNSDLARIINSDEIQTKVRAAREGFAKPAQKRNALKNLGTMLKLNPYVAQVKRAETAAAEVSASKKRKLSPTNTKTPGKKAKTVKAVARKAKDAALTNKAKFRETLRATPETPCTSFLDSYNKLEETMDKGVKAKK